MVDKKQIKIGFSLAEALISMLILSVFFIATSKVISNRQVREVQENPHGYFECYASGDQLKQKISSDMYSGETKTVQECLFDTPTGIAFAILYSMPNTDRVAMSVEPQFNRRVTIKSITELSNFPDKLDLSDENDITPEDLQSYLHKSYPSSDIGALLENGEYAGPALFIGW